MKQFLLPIGFLAAMLSSAAPTPDAYPETSRKDLNREIKKVLHYPDFAKVLHLEGVVAVRYKVESCGNLEVLEHSASDERLAAYVIDQLSKIQLRNYNNGHSGERILRVSFRYQE